MQDKEDDVVEFNVDPDDGKVTLARTPEATYAEPDTDSYEPTAVTNTGLYQKFRVVRTVADADHNDCFYFVLDLTHDKAARVAALNYAESIRPANEALADELFDKVVELMRQDKGEG